MIQSGGAESRIRAWLPAGLVSLVGGAGRGMSPALPGDGESRRRQNSESPIMGIVWRLLGHGCCNEIGDGGIACRVSWGS